MPPSSHKLALALAQRLGPVLPPPLTVVAQGPYVDLFIKGVRGSVGGSAACMIVEEDDDRTLAERVETAASAVLSTIQDDVAEYLTVEWPVEGGAGMALPSARSVGGSLHLWFGYHGAAPTISFDPIPLSELAAD